jgi:hypothetical protein
MIDKKIKKQVKEYIRKNLAKGHPKHLIKDMLVKYGYTKLFVENLFYEEKKKKKLLNYSTVGIMTILMILSIMFIGPAHTGLVTLNKQYDYSDNIELSINNIYEYNWTPNNPGTLISLRLNGSIGKQGYAKIYLRYENRSYLILDSNKLEESSITSITGLAIVDETIVDEASEKEENINITDDEETEKMIITKITGAGRKDKQEIFKLSAAAEFNWKVNNEKLCTRWSINTNNICYGSDDCCSLLDLESQGEWNSTLYLSYGRYDTKENNIIKSQVIYADYSLDPENPHSNIIYSETETAKADFHDARIEFEDICIDTCSISRLNASSYKIIFIVENTNLTINSIKYSIEEEIIISNNPLEFKNNIEEIIIYRNSKQVIDLSEYFTDHDKGNLKYSIYKMKDIQADINNEILTLSPKTNYTGKESTFITASDGYYNTSSNIFRIKVVEKPSNFKDVDIKEESIKPQVVINKPVKWIKRINSSANTINLSINISSDSINVTVRNLKENEMIDEKKVKVNDKGTIKDSITFRVEKQIQQIDKKESQLISEKNRIIREDPTSMRKVSSLNKELIGLINEKNKLTGYAIAQKEKGLLTRLFEWLFDVSLTGYVVLEKENINITSIIIEEIVKDIEIEYYTEAPIAQETNTSNGKKIVISSETHYEDILAYTYLDDIPKNSIRLYHIVNDTKEKIEFEAYDENNNSLIDYIEWVVPHLSNQTYELIIEISNAEHLDVNKAFISDVYNETYRLDDLWSEKIYHNEYVRVTFEVPLGNTRDITLYAKNNQSLNTTVEVYYSDSSDKITEFPLIKEERYYKIYLTAMQGIHDTFDLRINNLDDDSTAYLEFDHIIDPDLNTTMINITAPTNKTVLSKTYAEINITITESDLNELIYNWNGTNYTLYNDSLVLMFNFDNISALSECTIRNRSDCIIDMSKYKNNGTLGNSTSGTAPTWNATGKYKGAFEFDGSDDYIDLGNSSSLDVEANEFSIEAWFRSPAPSQNNLLFTSSIVSGQGYAFFIGRCAGGNSGNCIDLLKMGVIDQPVNYTFNASQWYHVVASQYFSGSNLSNVTYYVNGQSIGNFTNTTSYNSGINQTKRIGDKGNITNAQNFDGTIDELRIWNRSLSKDEVYQLYISNLRKYDTNKWKLYINQSQNSTNTLSNGAYTYQAFITDTSSNANQTEQRTLYIQDTIENATLQIKTVKDTYTPGEDVDLTDPPPG